MRRSNRFSSNTVSMDFQADQLVFIQNVMKDADAYKRRYPLYAAIFISPLVLLCEKNLSSRTLSQLDLMRVSFMLSPYPFD